MGDGRAQPGQARLGARCDRRAGRYAADRGRCQRSRLAEGDGRADQVGDHDGRSVSALWQRTGRGLRGIGHRLFRSLRRAGLDAADDRRASRRRRKRAARGSCSPAASIRCRSSSARSSCRRRPSACSARRPRASRAACATCAARSPAAPRRARKATFEAAAKDLSLVAILQRSVRADAGIRGPEAAAGQQAGVRGRPAILDRAVHDGDHQHPQRPSLQHADGFSLRQGLRLRRDGADRPRREGRGQRQARDGRQHREDRPERAEAGRGTVEGRARERALRSALCRDRARRPAGPRRR